MHRTTCVVAAAALILLLLLYSIFRRWPNLKTVILLSRYGIRCSRFRMYFTRIGVRFCSKNVGAHIQSLAIECWKTFRSVCRQKDYELFGVKNVIRLLLSLRRLLASFAERAYWIYMQSMLQHTFVCNARIHAATDPTSEKFVQLAIA